MTQRDRIDLADIAEMLPPYHLLRSCPGSVWLDEGEMAVIEQGLLLAYNCDAPYSCTRVQRVRRVQRAYDMPHMGVQSARAVAKMIELLDAAYNRVTHHILHEQANLGRCAGVSVYYHGQVEWAREVWQVYMDMGWPWLAGNRPCVAPYLGVRHE